MAGPNLCYAGGWTVQGELCIPSDPADYSQPVLADVFGCNQLRCLACGGPVRWHADVACSDDARDHLVELGEAKDWTALPFVVPTQGSRLYACSCTAWLENARRLMDDPDFDPDFDVSLPWECSGHPELALPAIVDGEEIGSAADVIRLADRVLGDWTPEGATPAYQARPAAWLCRLHMRLRGLPEADLLGEHLAEQLAEGDEAARGGALLFFGLVPRAAGFDRVVAHAACTTPEHLSEMVPTRYGSRMQSRSLLRILVERLRQNHGPRDGVDERTLAAVRSHLLAGGLTFGPTDLEVLVPLDAEWIATNAAHMVRGAPERLEPLLDRLVRTHRGELVVIAGMAMLRAQHVEVEQVQAWVDQPRNAGAPWTLVLQGALNG
jgi:hypothetical protein